MLIGELARRAGTSTRALRYYEANGLLDADRASNGYRTYGEDDVRVVAEIRARLAAGFGLDEIRPFVACLRAGHRTGEACPDSVTVLRRRLAEVEAGLAELGELHRQLSDQLERAMTRREGICGHRPR